MKTNQVKWGVILSYTLILLNAFYGLWLTPYILGRLGTSEYGVYMTISSLTSSLLVLDLGIGGTVMRYVAKYRAEQQDEKIANFVAMSVIQAVIMCGVILAVSVGLHRSISTIYADTFTPQELLKAQKLFCILIATVILHVMENVINGVITGHNRFAFGNGIKLIRLVFRILLVYVVLHIWADSIAIVLIDFFVTLGYIGIEVCYVHKKLGVHIRLSHWEKATFLDSGRYTVFMFLTSIAAQINSNLDNVIIGALSGPEFVAVYSMGLLIFAMFEHLSTAVSGVMLPTVTNLLKEDNGLERVKDLIIKVGRFQFILLGAAFAGFACVGREFILAWLGNGYEDVYIITLILMAPALFELCVNTCLSILRSKNMLGFRTGVLVASTCLNAIVTYVSISQWSYIGAAFGTAASFVIGSLIVMNIYYHRKFGFNMLYIYGKILDRTWLCLLLAAICTLLIKRFIHSSILGLVSGVIVFIAVYACSMMLFGLNSDEKRTLKIGGIQK